MTENSNSAPSGDPINNQGITPGTDPKQTSSVAPVNVDISKIGDEDFAKIFEDPRLWNHPRFKSLNDRAKKAEELDKKIQAEEESKLAKNKEWEELSNKRAAEREEWKNKYTQALQDNAIILEASKAGVVDTGAVLKLIERKGISVSDDNTVVGVDQAVKSLLDSSPWLKKTATTPTIGSGTNPGTNAGATKFKLSQIQNPAFYRQNEKAILEAYAAGNIEDDTK